MSSEYPFTSVGSLLGRFLLLGNKTEISIYDDKLIVSIDDGWRGISLSDIKSIEQLMSGRIVWKVYGIRIHLSSAGDIPDLMFNNIRDRDDAMRVLNKAHLDVRAKKIMTTWLKKEQIEKEAIEKQYQTSKRFILVHKRSELGWFLRHILLGDDPQPGLNTPNLIELDSEMRNMADNPSCWEGLDDDQLAMLFYQQAMYLAFGPKFGISDKILKQLINRNRVLHDLLQNRSSDRIQLTVDIIEMLDSDVNQIRALLQLLYDTDHVVVSTAAMAYALAIPLDNDDPMTGPIVMKQIAILESQRNPILSAGIINGLLSLGDQRVIEVLGPIWAGLPHEGLKILADAQPSALFAGHLEFLLRWLESVPEEETGLPAGILARLPNQYKGSGVLDVRRRFPAPATLRKEILATDPPYSVLRRWSVIDYGKIIIPRIERVADRESKDRIMPVVIMQWSN